MSPVELGSFVSTLPYYFCANENAGATSVTRSRSLPFDDFNVVISRQNDGAYELRRDYPDGRSETKYLEADALDCSLYDRDMDNDGVPDGDDEDIDGDGNVTNDDTDDDGVANYNDVDDDNDGILTINEDANGDGDPTNDDTDGDGTPDYLDEDN